MLTTCLKGITIAIYQGPPLGARIESKPALQGISGVNLRGTKLVFYLGGRLDPEIESQEESAMIISDEMTKLAELHRNGVLTDEEFARAKGRLLGVGVGLTSTPLLADVNALRRSRSDRWIAGVCGGLARATKMESWLWRLLFVLLTLFGGVGLVVYVLMWIFVPEEV